MGKGSNGSDYSQTQKEIRSNSVQRETLSDRFLEPEEEIEETESSGPSDVWLMEYSFNDDMFVGNENSKEKKLRSQKRKDLISHLMSVEKNSAIRIRLL